MKITLVSNYINHHQIPFCNEIAKRYGTAGRDQDVDAEGFCFIQTSDMESDRKAMGWDGSDLSNLPEYVWLTFGAAGDEAKCRKRILVSDVVIFGGCEDESFIKPRLDKGLFTFRYSERMYREGQWKFITPRGLIRKYKDHTAYNRSPVYLLCAGAYVASDFGIFGAYKNKMYKWGYFPEFREYDEDTLMGKKDKDSVVILWVARFIKLKHPERALRAAKYLKDKNTDFTLRMIGEGPERKASEELAESLGISDCVRFCDFMTPEKVRDEMEKADVFLFTSDRLEGWGAVINESMNSGCAVIAEADVGASSYLIESGVNGYIYHGQNMLNTYTEKLVTDRSIRQGMGRNAYRTIKQNWTPAVAAKRLELMIDALLPESRGESDVPSSYMIKSGPGSADRPRSEKSIRRSAIAVHEFREI